MEAIDRLIEQSQGFDERKRGMDFKVRPADVTFAADGGTVEVPVLGGGKLALALTDNATEQVYRKLAPVVFGVGNSKTTLPKDYMQGIPSVLKAISLQILAATTSAKWPNREWFVRGYEGEKGSECRAVLNGSYPVIENTDLLRTVGVIMDKAASEGTLPDLHLATSHVTPDALYLRSIWQEVHHPKGNGYGGYSIGAFIGNSEIGRGYIEVLPLVQVNLCQNSIIVRQKAARTIGAAYGELVDDEDSQDEFVGLRLAHRGNTDSIRYAVRVAINQAFGGGAEMLDRIFKAEEQQLPDFGAVLGGLAIKFGWSEDTQTQVRTGTEGADTRMAVVNGITFAAQFQEDPHARAAMEIEGGNVLVAADSLFAQAARRYHDAEAEVVVAARRR
jgi:hypothetical protein